MLNGPLGNLTAETETDEPRLAERRWAARLAAGDQTAFDELVRAHRDRVTRLASRLLGWPDEVDDVVQDVFLAAYRSLGRFRGEARIDTWLTTITLNRCRSVRRWRWLRLRLPRRATPQREASSGRPDQPAENAELLAEVREAVRHLAQTDREAIVLRYLEGASVDTIASLLGVSRGAVEVRLSRARNRLRDVLSPKMEQ